MKGFNIPLIVKKIRQSLAIVENGSTASRNIAVGKYVLWKGDLYTVKTAITSGDTLSSTNLDSVSDGGLNSLSSKPILWENDKAGTNEFAGQSVEFDTSGFEWFLVTFNNFYTQQDKVSFICKKNEKSRASVVNGLNGEYSGAISAGLRDFTITSTGATFTPAYSMEAGSSVNRNGILTPVAVYGWIK